MRWNGSHNHYTVGDVTTKSKGDQLHKTEGSHSTVANSDILHTTQKNYTTSAEKAISTTAKEDASHKGKTLTTEATGGDNNVKASGDVVIKGSSTKIQGGGQHAPPTTFS